jgi:transcriptional regulator with XRE-family HTH domain
LKVCDSWRDLLKQIISQKQEHQRIAQAMRVHPVTLTRWATGTTTPRPAQLRALLNALPSHRKQLEALLTQCDPDLFAEIAVESAEVYYPELPSTFYAQVVECYRKTPLLIRAFAIRMMIIQQLLFHFDPRQQGIMVFLVECVPPAAGHPVRSCHAVMGRGTSPWDGFTEQQTLFFGAESQVGSTVMYARPYVIQSREQQVAQFPLRPFVLGESTATYPILISGRIAGALCIITAQPDAFSLNAQEIIQQYANLLVLGFEPETFYDLSDLQFGVMPLAVQQEAVLASFHQRVMQHLVQANQSQQSLTRAQVECLVFQEMEEELLHFTSPI